MAPTWADLADKYNEGSEFAFAKIDCTDEEARPVCESYEVRGYPSLLFFPGLGSRDSGKYHTYKGPRQMEHLEAFTTGGYLDAETEPEEVQKDLEGLEYYQKMGSRAVKQL